MITEKMRAVVFEQAGEAEVMKIAQVSTPAISAGKLLVKVRAAAINRADTLQRRGKYPPPAGDSTILGLEIAGEIVAIGEGVTGFELGERVLGLVGGGAYAQYCLLDAKLALPMLPEWDFTYAAAIPEVFLTANETVFELGLLQSGQQLLLHAAASGVGTAAIQMAHHIGAQIFATVGSEEKRQKVAELGANFTLNYKTEDFLPWVLEHTQHKGVDVVEDFVGKDNFQRNLQALKPGGRLIQVATMSGAITELDLRLLMSKRLQICGSVMRSRSIEDKRAITARFVKRWWPALVSGEIKPIIAKIYDWQDVVAAHQYMESNANIGKIVLKFTE